MKFIAWTSFQVFNAQFKFFCAIIVTLEFGQQCFVRPTSCVSKKWQVIMFPNHWNHEWLCTTGLFKFSFQTFELWAWLQKSTNIYGQFNYSVLVVFSTMYSPKCLFHTIEHKSDLVTEMNESAVWVSQYDLLWKDSLRNWIKLAIPLTLGK